MVTLVQLSKRARSEARDMGLLEGLYTGEPYDEALLDAMLARMGSQFNGELLKDSVDAYGPPTTGKVVPPREDGGALPGLGLAQQPMTMDPKGLLYTLASQAWMHVNCDAGPDRYLWQLVLDACREGRIPREELAKIRPGWLREFDAAVASRSNEGKEAEDGQDDRSVQMDHAGGET